MSQDEYHNSEMSVLGFAEDALEKSGMGGLVKGTVGLALVGAVGPDILEAAVSEMGNVLDIAEGGAKDISRGEIVNNFSQPGVYNGLEKGPDGIEF